MIKKQCEAFFFLQRYIPHYQCIIFAFQSQKFSPFQSQLQKYSWFQDYLVRAKIVCCVIELDDYSELTIISQS